MVDAQIDAFKARIQKRLAEAQPADLSALSQELTKFKVDLTASLEALIPVLETILVDKQLFDIFEEDPPYAPRKRPVKDTDAEEGHKRQMTSEESKELEEQINKFVLKTSREKQELRKAQELEKLQDVDSSCTVATQTTPLEGGTYRQSETDAQAPFDL